VQPSRQPYGSSGQVGGEGVGGVLGGEGTWGELVVHSCPALYTFVWRDHLVLVVSAHLGLIMRFNVSLGSVVMIM
jgi:hypothetical protein